MANLRRLNNSDKDFNITTLYVRTLAGKHREEKLRRDDILNHFSAFGDVRSVRLRNKPKRSYGFVKFTQPESAVKALQSKVDTIAGLKVEIDVAHDRHQDFVRFLEIDAARKVQIDAARILKIDAVHHRYQDCVSLLDLNNDCLLEIFSQKCLDVDDLCTLAITNRRLKEIATEVFKRQYKKCNLSAIVPKNGKESIIHHSRYGSVTVLFDSVAKRILKNFGAVISELQINGFEFKEKNRKDLLDYVSRYCRDSLVSLTLESFNIHESLAAKLQPIFNNLQKFQMTCCTFEGSSKELFDDCPEMVELVVSYDEGVAFITEKTFPKLKHFGYEPKFQGNLESFLSRHQHLQVLNIPRCKERPSLVQSIADNCRQLEELECYIPRGTTLDLSNIGRLRKLKFYFDKQSITEASMGWNNLHFLVEIKLERVDVNLEFVRVLAQMKGLQVLELEHCTGIQNLQQIDKMNQLTTFLIASYEEDFNNSDLIRLIQRFDNLKYLSVNMSHFYRLDTETYLHIVDIVRRRSDKYQLFFRLCTDCQSTRDEMDQNVFYQNRHLVKMFLGCDCYGY